MPEVFVVDDRAVVWYPGQAGPDDPVPSTEEVMTKVPGSVGVIGGGRMGAGIARVLATAGAPVWIVESDDAAAAAAHDRGA